MRAAAWVRGAVGATLFVAGAVVGRSCAGTDVATPRTDRPSIVADAAAIAPPSPRVPRRAAKAPAPARVDEVAASAADVDAAPPPNALLTLDVDVVAHDGTPVEGALVYALRAGAPGVDEEKDVPHDETNAQGRARLAFVKPGRFDVGAVLGALARLATDIDVPRAGPLRIELPEGADVNIRVDPSAVKHPGETAGVGFGVRICPPAEGDDANLPGRGQRSSTTWDYSWGDDASPSPHWTCQLPRGARFSAYADSGLTVHATGDTAPAEVVVTRLVAYPVQFAPRMVPSDRTYAEDRRFVVTIRWDGADGEANKADRDWMLPAGRPTSSVFVKYAAWARVRDPAGVVSWSGDGIRDGSKSFDGLDLYHATTIELSMELDDAHPPPIWKEPQEAPPTSVPHRLRVVGADDAGPACVVVVRADGESDSMDAERRGEAVESDGHQQYRWGLAHVGDFVSPVVDLAADGGDAPPLELTRGGYLVVLPTGKLPDKAGKITIERADGRPFLVGEPWLAADVHPGLVLGPLPPGEIELRFRIAGEDVGHVRAVVKAGAYEPLRTPRIGGK